MTRTRRDPNFVAFISTGVIVGFVVGSAFAISVFLMIYYAAVGFFVIYFESLYGYSPSKANSIGNWFWAFDAGVLVIIGIISDKVRVRKPFMVVGAIGAVVMTIIFANLGKGTSYSTFVVVISVLAAFLAIAYAPWMASFTETVEKHNPAATATGLARSTARGGSSGVTSC